MSDTLKGLLKLKMERKNLSLRQAGNLAGVAHTTIDRVLKGETVDLETVKKICDWIGIPVSSVVDIGDEKAPMVDEVASLISMNKDFAKVLTEISEKIKSGKLSQDILIEITAFASFQLDQRVKKAAKKK